jgi:hypothetical protein
MPIPPVISELPQDKRSSLDTIAKTKFDAYFWFTSGAGTPPRSVPDQAGQPWFIYPKQTMVADLVFLWCVFMDVYTILGPPAELARIIQSDENLRSDFHSIIEGTSAADPDGSFWQIPGGRVPLAEAEGTQLRNVLRTLRNGFAHSSWLFEDLSAVEYWNRLGWQTANAFPTFDLHNRPAKNYMMYIADAARPWEPQNFWSMTDLRLLVTPSTVLRFRLHLFLNYLLNGSRENVFQH